jgi:homoserine O-succinyltransferase
MPVIIPDKLPAKDILSKENIFTIEHSKAISQDIRALRIAILNIMPMKEATETHILRLLTNTPVQVEIQFIRPKGHQPKNTPQQHLEYFYKTFEEVSHQKFDGLIITGAPVEHLSFEEVNYWEEFRGILDWSVHNVTSVMLICWAAQAGLYHFHGIPKYQLPSKMSGNFHHTVNNRRSPIARGFDDRFLAPHSRHTEVRRSDIENVGELEIISESEEAGVYIVVSRDGKRVYVTGHSEYDSDTLGNEYQRDRSKGLEIAMPVNYYPGNDPLKTPEVTWRSHANLLFLNWLNYYVYQSTPYDIKKIG